MEFKSEWFEKVPEVQGEEGDMRCFSTLIEKLENQGKFEEGAILFKPFNYNPVVKSNTDIRKMFVKKNSFQYVSEIKKGYFFISRYPNEKENPKEDDNILRDMSCIKPDKNYVHVSTIMKKGDCPEKKKTWSDEKIMEYFWEQLCIKGKEGQFDKRSYWAEYASDIPGSMFVEGENSGIWTLNNLKEKIQQVVHYYEYCVVGMTSPMLYIGTWLSQFVDHIEDKNSWSISYLHFGSPKFWFFIHPEDKDLFEKMSQNDLMNFRKKIFSHMCTAIFRHKCVMVHPLIIHGRKIRMKMVVQKPNEFVIIPPCTYHFGFNAGANVAESCNFVTKSWLPHGLLAKECSISSKFKNFDMEMFVLNDMTEHYADYVNGKLKVMNPLGSSDKKFPVNKSKLVAIEVDAMDPAVRVAGVYDFLFAKTQAGVEYVFIALYSAKTWMTRVEAEKLFWNKQNTAVKFPDFLFNMEDETLEIFPKVATVLRNYVGDTSLITLEYLKKQKLLYQPEKDTMDHQSPHQINGVVAETLDNNAKKNSEPNGDDVLSSVMDVDVEFGDDSTSNAAKNTVGVSVGPLKIFYNSLNTCSKCGITRINFESQFPEKSFFDHLRGCGEPCSFVCRKCKKSFKRKYLLAKHMMKDHV